VLPDGWIWVGVQSRELFSLLIISSEQETVTACVH